MEASDLGQKAEARAGGKFRPEPLLGFALGRAQ